MSNIIIILIKRSREILRKKGIAGYIIAIKKYYEAYPPLHKNLYYWLYSKLHPSKMVIREIQGSKMYLNLNDFGLSKQLVLKGIREPECTRIMKKELKKGMVIAEIGANIGYYALIEASIIGEKGKIYAIEPFPINFDHLQKNIKINSYDKIIEPYNLAISNRSGKEKLFVTSKHNLCNMLANKEEEFVEVKTDTLDNFIKNKKNPDLIRMDIEGFEYYAIEGMKKTISKCNSCKMFIEVHPYQMNQKGLDYKKPINMIFNLGFKPKYIVKEHGPLKEESFEYNQPLDKFFKFLEEKKLIPPEYTHGFGLFLEKTGK
jgi:FkbM family methyltransferase